MGIRDVLPLILSAGGATFLTACVQAWQAKRANAESREAKVLARLERERDNSAKRADREQALADYWRSWAATLEYELRVHGVPLPRRPKMPAED